MVDRTLFGLRNRGVKPAVDKARLADETRRPLAQKLTERLEGEEPYEGERHKLRLIIQRQARRVATHVCGEATCQPWVARW